jgi:hypothetical protein
MLRKKARARVKACVEHGHEGFPHDAACVDDDETEARGAP